MVPIYSRIAQVIEFIASLLILTMDTYHMGQKKYQIHTSEQDGNWSASIIRKVSTKKSYVTKSQDEFSTEEAATAWAKAELDTLLQVLAVRNQRHKK